jgi:GNAT superfamily N-acetyltransferase
MISVRSAGRDDAARIVEMSIAVSAHEGLAAPAITAEALIHFAFVERLLEIIVAEGDKGVVGHVITTRSFDVQCGAPTRWIEELYVEPAYRSRGIARKLIAAVADRAIGEGAAYLQWLVRPGNTEAEGFYKSIGGRRDGGVAMFLRAAEFKGLATAIN